MDTRKPHAKKGAVVSELLPEEIKRYINEDLRPALEELEGDQRRRQRWVVIAAGVMTTAAIVGLAGYLMSLQGAPMGWVDWAVALGIVGLTGGVLHLCFYGLLVRGREEEFSERVLRPLLEYQYGEVKVVEERREQERMLKEELCQWSVDRFGGGELYEVQRDSRPVGIQEVEATMRVRLGGEKRPQEKSCYQLRGWVMARRWAVKGADDVVVSVMPRGGGEERREVKTLDGEVLEARSAGGLAVVPWSPERAEEAMRPLHLPHVEFDDLCEVWTNDVAAARGLIGEPMVEALSRAAKMWRHAEGRGYFHLLISGGQVMLWWPRVTTVAEVRFLDLGEQTEWLVEWARDIGAAARILDAA